MKKFTFLAILIIFGIVPVAKAQIQAGNVLIGGDLANFNWGLNSPGTFTGTFTPKAAWFIQDNIALGGYATFGITTTSGEGSNVIYSAGALGRYYKDSDVSTLKHGRWFGEATVGIGGQSHSGGGGSTTGLDFSFGPGFAYFVTPNIGLEAILKYAGVLGFGSTAYQNNLNFSFGFQIYLPGKSTAQKVSGDVK